MNSSAKVILTSDDFGLSRVYNEKILEMLSAHGYLSSVSVMVNRISVDQMFQVKELIKIYRRKDISIGLHLELSNVNYITELQEQFSLFEIHFGFSPDYLDIHKSSCFKGDYNLLAEYCNLKHVAFRKYQFTTIAVASPTRSILATNMADDDLEKNILNFENNKIYEVIFHIGTYDPCSKSKLNKERELDIVKLANVCQWIEKLKLELVNYKSLNS